MHFVGISTYQFIPYYASTRILKPFEDSELTALKVDIAKCYSCFCIVPFKEEREEAHFNHVCVLILYYSLYPLSIKIKMNPLIKNLKQRWVPALDKEKADTRLKLTAADTKEQ